MSYQSGSRSWSPSSGPFASTDPADIAVDIAVMASNVPFGFTVVQVIGLLADSPDPRQRPFGPEPRHRRRDRGIRPVRPRSRPEGAGLPSWCSRRLSTHRHWLLGSSLSRRGVEPASRPTDQAPSGAWTPSGFHVPHA